MYDLTTKSVPKTLFFFALPILIGNLFQQCYNIADSIIVGNFLGTQALAAVGFCFQFHLILIALSMGLTLGISILISRFFGEKTTSHIRSMIDTGFLFSLILSICVTIIGICISPLLVRIFFVPSDTISMSTTYLRILFAGSVPIFLYNTLTNILRGLGDSKRPVYYLAFASLLNIALDLLFVKVLSLGIAGAAIATLLSQLFCFIGVLLSIQKNYPDFHIRIRHLTLDSALLKNALKIGIPSMIQQLLRSIGFLSLQGMVNSFGSSVMAAYTATQKIDSFALLPNLNLGQALSNFTAQNRGAKQLKRTRLGFFSGLIMGWCITIAISCIVIPLAPQIMSFFSANEDVIAIGAGYIRIVSTFYFVETAMQILNGFLLGYEKPFMPMISTIVSLLIVQVPIAFFLSKYTFFSYTGIWIAAPFGWGSGVAIRLFYFVKTLRENKQSN
ncbi:MATE family efflux transporter [Eubacterium oxidoreducens]|uniref:Probable multidrug resistance protein NorM n=1 Tax=Eubacterium oxidoreducens TaxID=1732 RepID=A0A1G6BKP8_EUBOX|nr:MATE family efflux transporter [Eubacterium oxidoreducens]SDB21222.1 putative efflux protein, MATE family [Eubacterium oxidoreducens]